MDGTRKKQEKSGKKPHRVFSAGCLVLYPKPLLQIARSELASRNKGLSHHKFSLNHIYQPLYFGTLSGCSCYVYETVLLPRCLFNIHGLPEAVIICYCKSDRKALMWELESLSRLFSQHKVVGLN